MVAHTDNILTKEFILYEEDVTGKGYKCDTECLFKFNFQEQSTSYRLCIFDSSSNPPQLPTLKITNEFLSNTNNPGMIAVNFQNDNYWFNSLYITRPSYIFMNYVNSIYPSTTPNPIGLKGSTDISSSSLLIVCKNRKGDSLRIQQNIISRQTAPSNSGGSELTNIINAIANADISYNNIYCSSNSILPLSKININNLISTTRKYYYYSSSNTDGNNDHYIIFSGLNPLIISNSVRENLESFFYNSSLTINILPTPLKSQDASTRVFISSKNPIGNLSEGEDNIYIKCQPTDQEGNILISGQSVAPRQDPFDLNNVLGDNKNMFTAAIMGIVIMIIIVKGGEFLLKNGTRTLLGSI